MWRFLKTLGIKLPYDPTTPLLGIYLEKTKIEKDTCTTMFTAALLTMARTWQQPRCPSTDDKEAVLSCVLLFATPWTTGSQTPLQWDSTGKNPEVGSHSLLQGICLTQGLNPGLLHFKQILYYLSDQGSPGTYIQ